MSRLVVFLLRLLGRLPLAALYVLSDVVLYPVVRHVVRYRRRVVEKNLGLAFPDKSDQERLLIERHFYHHLCDILVETVRLQYMSPEELSRRFQWQPPAATPHPSSSTDSRFTLCYLAHYGNWEWLTARLMPTDHHGTLFIYHPLHNTSFDRWLSAVRSRFGTELVDMHHVSERLDTLGATHRHYHVLAISDQLPKEQYVRHFHHFMGIKSKVLTGTEQLIRHYGMQVVYCHVTCPRRGYYVCRPIPLTLEESNATHSPFPYTDAYTDLLQQQINDAPHLWLWSHDRWHR